jgi:hypothetical protein
MMQETREIRDKLACMVADAPKVYQRALCEAIAAYDCAEVELEHAFTRLKCLRAKMDRDCNAQTRALSLQSL